MELVGFRVWGLGIIRVKGVCRGSFWDSRDPIKGYYRDTAALGVRSSWSL